MNTESRVMGVIDILLNKVTKIFHIAGKWKSMKMIGEKPACIT